MSGLLDLSDLKYQAGDFSLRVARLTINCGDSLLLLGPSGSGKSTLLNLLTGVSSPNAGSITIAGQDLTKLSGPARDRLRAEQFGIIFQSLNLLPFGSVRDNILAALSFAPERRKRTIAGADLALAEKLGLSADLLNRPAKTLSVGQQQRVAVARALIGAPALIVADEPTSALDEISRERFLDLLFAAFDPTRQALLVVSHDRAIANRFSRVIELPELAQ